MTLGRSRRSRSERGLALLVVLLALSAVLALGLGVALAISTETAIAANSHEGTQVAMLAQAAAEQAVTDLASLTSWDGPLRGAVVSRLFDGATGTRMAAGHAVDLGVETARVTCGLGACGGVSPSAATPRRPWGANNPRWRVFASGPAATLLGSRAGVVPGYAAAWIGDDPSENDGDPFTDGGVPLAGAGSSVNPGLGVVWLRVAAWGPRGSRTELDLVVERDDPVLQTGLRVRTWRVAREIGP